MGLSKKKSSVAFLIIILLGVLVNSNQIFAQDKATKIDELMTKIAENGQTKKEAGEGQKKNGSRSANQTNGGKKPGESAPQKPATPGSKEALKRLGI